MQADFSKSDVKSLNNGVKNPCQPSKCTTEHFCFLNIYKPRGITSFDVIHKLRKQLGIKKIGHSGTLDPLADGVLQIGIGKAARLLDYLGSDKKYTARVKFGYFSTTGDAEGEITKVNESKFTPAALRQALKELTGEIEQIPPMYSAIKVGGKKLCDIARKADLTRKNGQGEVPAPDIQIPKRNVTIYEAKILSLNPLPGQTFVADYDFTSGQTFAVNYGSIPAQTPDIGQNFTTGQVALKNQNTVEFGADYFAGRQPLQSCDCVQAPLAKGDRSAEYPPDEIEIEIFCSKGTYIRTFAVDLAKKLGTAAYLTALTRTLAGNFSIENSAKIDEVSPETLHNFAINPVDALDLPKYFINEEEYKKVLNGVSIPFLSQKAQATSKRIESTLENVQIEPESSIPATALMLIFENNLVSIANLSDNRIICKKVFK